MVFTDELTWALWSVCAGIALVCLRLPSARYGSLRWLNPRVFFGFAFLFLNVLTALNIMTTGATYRGFFFQSEFNLVLLASALAGASFLVGWHLGIFQPRPRRPVLTEDTVPAGRYAQRAWLLVPVVLLTLAISRRGLGGSDTWLTVLIFGQSSQIAAGVLFALAIPAAPSRARRLLWRVLGALVVLAYLWVMLQQGTRLRFLLLVLPFAALWLSRHRHIRAWVPIGAALAALWFFAFYGAARYHMLYEGRSLYSLVQVVAPRNLFELYSRLFSGGDLDALENGMLLMGVVPKWDDFCYGATFATLFVLPIPRAWWPGKPSASVNGMLAQRFNLPNENFAISLVAEAYANASWPAIVLVFLAFGFLSARVFLWAVERQEDAETWVHLGLFGAYVILVMRGSFHSMTSYYLMVVVWLVASERATRLLRTLGPALRADAWIPLALPSREAR